MCSIAKDVKASIGGAMPGSTLPGGSSIGNLLGTGARRVDSGRPQNAGTLLTGPGGELTPGGAPGTTRQPGRPYLER